MHCDIPRMTLISQLKSRSPLARAKGFLPFEQMSREEPTVKSLDKDVEKAFDRIRYLEQDRDTMQKELESEREFHKAHAKLTVFNTRDGAEQKGGNKIVCYIAGELKDTLKTKFSNFRNNAKARREEKEAGGKGGGAKGDGKGGEGEEGVKSEMLVDASSAEAGSMIHPGWPGVFHDEAVKWFKDQIKEGGPKVAIQSKMQRSVDNLESLPTLWAYRDVIMSPQECPTGTKPWIANITVKGGSSGAMLFEVLTEALAPLYRSVGENRKSFPADLSCKADVQRFDRPITQEVAAYAGMKVRVKQNRFTGSASASAPASASGKRRSPEPNRTGRKARHE